jgi:hypothetical protein
MKGKRPFPVARQDSGLATMIFDDGALAATSQVGSLSLNGHLHSRRLRGGQIVST